MVRLSGANGWGSAMMTASFYALLVGVTVFSYAMLPFESRHGIPYSIIAMTIWILAIVFAFRCRGCRWPITLFRDPRHPSLLGVFPKFPNGHCSKCGLRYDRKG